MVGTDQDTSTRVQAAVRELLPQLQEATIAAAALAIGLVVTLAACGSNRASPAASGDTGTKPTTVTAAASRTASPTPNLPLEVLKKGFGLDQYGGIGWAFVVRNPNAETAAEVQYQVAAYDAAGTVLDTASGTAPVIFGRSDTGIAGDMFVKDKTVKPDRIDVQLKPTKFGVSDLPTDLLTAENVTFGGDAYSQYVTGIVRTKATKDLKSIRAFAVTYDQNGEITGGGRALVDFVPASGQAAAKVSVRAAGKPAKVELYASLSNLSLNGFP